MEGHGKAAGKAVKEQRKVKERHRQRAAKGHTAKKESSIGGGCLYLDAACRRLRHRTERRCFREREALFQSTGKQARLSLRSHLPLTPLRRRQLTQRCLPPRQGHISVPLSLPPPRKARANGSGDGGDQWLPLIVPAAKRATLGLTLAEFCSGRPGYQTALRHHHTQCAVSVPLITTGSAPFQCLTIGADCRRVTVDQPHHLGQSQRVPAAAAAGIA